MPQIVALVSPSPVNWALWGVASYVILFVVGFKWSVVYLLLYFSGILTSLVALVYYLFVFKVRKPHARSRPSRFKFLDSVQWKLQRESLQADEKALNAPIAEESFLISETLDEFVALIIQEFIDTWFPRISGSRLFQDSIAIELKKVFGELKTRLANVDLAKLLVSKILPLINDHITEYLHAVERVNTKTIASKMVLDPLSYDIEVARSYRRGKIHPGVTVTKTGPTDVNEKTYLRQKLGDLLPYVLSANEKNNETGVALVREILACTIVSNVLQMIGEGDFFNLLIVKLIGESLQRRDQVKRLRAALDEHTQQVHEDKNLNKKFIITESMDVVAYQKCLESIDTCVSADELKQLRVYISFQLLQLPKTKESQALEARLRQAQETLEKRIKELESIKVKSIDLRETLNSPGYLGEFKKFMAQEDKLNLLTLWIAIEELKAPMDFMDDKLSLSLGFSNYAAIKRIYEDHIKPHSVEVDASDIKKIEVFLESKDLIEKSELYQQVRQSLVRYQEKTFLLMESTYFKEFMKTPEYQDLMDRKTSMAQTAKVPASSDPNVVVKAVEDAFTQIMKTQTFYDDTQLDDDEADTSDVIASDSSSSHNRYSQIFDDMSDESGTDSDSVNFESSETESGDGSLVLAAPGNLKLTEEIDKLDDEITRLGEQQKILEPLIKKAELTNNAGELKILRNSFVSLEREINGKELQKQQYIVQENDNSLFGKSRVTIQSYISGNDHNKEYILYIIEVQKYASENPDVTTAGWIVARRFSQFYKLHEYLRVRYDGVSTLKFPKRTMLKFQQRQVVEMRKRQLEEYLQRLLENRQVCSDRVFRSFLSSEEFNVGRKSSVGHATTKLLSTSLSRGKRSRPNDTTVQNLREMERELKSYDDKEVFVKPMVDVLMTVFKLRSSKSWLRGRALLIILQQMFGTTIENKIYESVAAVQTEERVLDVLVALKNVVFPGGRFKDPPILRSGYERQLTQNEARTVLGIFVHDTFSTIFGSKNCKYAQTVVFGTLQNDFLNRHLALEVMDELIKEFFPESCAVI